MVEPKKPVTFKAKAFDHPAYPLERDVSGSSMESGYTNLKLAE